MLLRAGARAPLACVQRLLHTSTVAFPTSTVDPARHSRRHQRLRGFYDRLAHNIETVVGVESNRCRRGLNDDRFVVAEFKDDPTIRVLGVYDGHGGPGAAEFCRANLHERIFELLQQSADDNHVPVRDLSRPCIAEVLRNAFLDVDHSFLEHVRLRVDERGENQSPGALSDFTGTTATVALFVGNSLSIANVGDSPAWLVGTDVLSHRLTVRRCTQLHKTAVPSEARRIHLAGGFNVAGLDDDEDGRVLGILNMTRAIGDRRLKPFGVTAEPSIVQHVITPDDAFLLLASDGLFECTPPTDIFNTLMSAPTPTEAAMRAALTAELQRTEDNTTALVVALPAWARKSRFR